MKTIRKNVRRAVRRINGDRVVRIAGGVVACIGFFILLGAIGSADLDLTPLREVVLYVLFGLSLFVGGAYTARIFDFQQPVDGENMPDTVEELLGAIAYNPKYRSWMMIVDYRCDIDWSFVLCTKHGKVTSTPARTTRHLLSYKWML